MPDKNKKLIRFRPDLLTRLELRIRQTGATLTAYTNIAVSEKLDRDEAIDDIVDDLQEPPY